jgi:hypothetical protein
MEKPVVERPTFRREIGRVRGQRPGPTLILVAGQHGNEPGGVIAAERVFRRLSEERPELTGELVAFAGNVKALSLGTRYLTHDLNRAWTEAKVVEIRHKPPEQDDTEDSEHRELLASIDAAIARARGEVFLLDLHTTSAAGTPFVLFGDTLRQRAFGAHFPLPIILGLEEQVDGVLSQLMTKRGCVTVAIEGGQHDDPGSVDALEACIWVGMDAARLVPRQHLSPWSAAHRLLDARRGELPHVMEVLHRHAIRPEDQFKMEPGFANLASAKEGQLLARDASGEIRAEANGLVMLPLYQGQGADGFFWGRPVSNTRLLASTVARRLHLDWLLPLLPGVAREGDALVVDAGARKRYPDAFFHTFGFRKERKDGERVSVARAPD